VAGCANKSKNKSNRNDTTQQKQADRTSKVQAVERKIGASTAVKKILTDSGNKTI
jgi:hypothetical protein